MFTTINEVKRLTGYEVTNETIHIAQAIIESYIGRIEAQVVDGVDRQMLERAVGYQAAYMQGDGTKVFEQISAVQIQQFGQMITFKPDGTSPWIAPLAVIACKHLTWKNAKSIKVGGIYDNFSYTYDWRRD